MIDSDDYHDFVIKDGKLIAEFDEMYKKSKDIPWHQDKQINDLDIKVTVKLLKEFGPFDSIVDFGCGLGYFLNILNNKIGKDNCLLFGYDISETCCIKARKLFPGINFNTLDLTKNNNIAENKFNGTNLFCLRGTLWYVFNNIENVVVNINKLMKKNDLLLISQNFPPQNINFVGKEIIPNPEAIIKLFDCFDPQKSIFIQDYNLKNNNDWFIGIFKK